MCSVEITLRIQFCTPESVLPEVLAMDIMSESYKSSTLDNVIGEFMQAHGNACISLGTWVLLCLHLRRFFI